MQRENKIKLIPRNGLSKHEYIKQYYYQDESWRKLYDSGNFTDDELLYIFNNGTLRRLGFPMRRGGKKYRCEKRGELFDWWVFNIFKETINEFFSDNFVNVKNIAIDNENKFSTENI